LNPHINKAAFIDEIKEGFGLSASNISEVRVIADGSKHYQCFLDCRKKEFPLDNILTNV